jgi:hypothetical protein
MSKLKDEGGLVILVLAVIGAVACVVFLVHRM